MLMTCPLLFWAELAVANVAFSEPICAIYNSPWSIDMIAAK
jgi:hypothetical protein